MDYKLLSEVSVYRKDRIASDKVNKENYISTENMIPNRGGVESAAAVADAKTFPAYKKGDILLSNIRPYFKKIWYADKDGGCSNDVLIVKANKNVDSKFLYYVLSDNNFFNYSTVTSKGTKMPRGSKNAIMKYWIPNVNLSIQRKIANILSAYDELIDVNNHRIELLEQAAQELYKEWFVRFRFPGYENVKFENGLPEGWELKRMVDLFDITSSKRVYLADYVDVGVPFYRSKEIIQLSQRQTITEPLYISNAAYENFKSKYGAPEKNDILITSVGTIGVSYLVDGHEFYFKDGNLTWIKSGSNKVMSLFLFQWLNSQSGKQQLLQSTIGTSQSALTIENLKKIKLLVPTNALIENYYQKVNAMLEQKSVLQMKNRNLAMQRDMLLPRLMSSKI